jgi:hypothetical protein
MWGMCHARERWEILTRFGSKPEEKGSLIIT